MRGAIATRRGGLTGGGGEHEILAAQAALNLTEEHEDDIMPLWKSEIYVDAGILAHVGWGRMHVLRCAAL